MATSPWKKMPIVIPTNGATVWVRTIITPNPPFKAVWDVTTQQFTDIVNSMILPWYMVYEWRPL